ncbi:MAG TPA: DUF6510 family protein [Candidatus Binatia bacterium]|nr:DUF6510 family protein [Candidatus Binatia bacterium]
MDETQLRLDGNAAGGFLQEILAQDATSMRIRCHGCGSVAQVGAQPLYMYPGSPGAVLRCRACECILMVVVRGPGRLRIGLPGVTWLELPEPSDVR